MRKLLNTLFVLNPDTYLSLDNNAVLIQQDEKKLQRIPLLQLEQIYYFGYKGASPALMGYCSSNNIRLAFISPKGKFLCAVYGENKGNVLLRKEQYRISDNEERSVAIARNFIIGKIYNSRRVLLKAARDYSLRINCRYGNGFVRFEMDLSHLRPKMGIFHEMDLSHLQKKSE